MVQARRSRPLWVAVSEVVPLPLDGFPDNLGPASDIGSILVRDPRFFLSGQLHENLTAWEDILGNSPEDQRIRGWLRNGVSIGGMLRPFKGNFKGQPYDEATPPRVYFPNSTVCAQQSTFVARALEERLQNGSIELLSRWDEVEWPTCIMPLTVEPTKPRLWHDERFFNLFIKVMPFKLDTLRDVPRLVEAGSMLFTTDDKSGYDQIKLAPENRRFFGLMYNGWVMRYT